jgi:hypothetical protein
LPSLINSSDFRRDAIPACAITFCNLSIYVPPQCYISNTSLSSFYLNEL